VPQRLGGEEEETQRHFYVRHLWAGARGREGRCWWAVCSVL